MASKFFLWTDQGTPPRKKYSVLKKLMEPICKIQREYFYIYSIDKKMLKIAKFLKKNKKKRFRRNLQSVWHFFLFHILIQQIKLFAILGEGGLDCDLFAFAVYGYYLAF